MTKTRINKLLAMFLTVLMTIAFGTFVPMNKVKAASQADALVSVALAEEGYTEGSNNYSKYGEWYYNNVSQSIDYSHADWCAMFISWCARQAGIPTSIIKNNAWAGSMSSSKRTGNFGGQYYPKGSITPQKGDIAYYGWGSSSSQHVEIVISTSGNTFTSIGGNTGGGTKVYVHKNYSFTSSDVVGFERPNYDGNTPYPEYIDVNISPGTSNTPSKFSWEESKGANNYYLRIFNSAGTKEVISVWGTDGKLSWDLQLDAGEYTAQVGAISASNSDYVTWSGLKTFVVKATPIVGDINSDGKFNISDAVLLQKWLVSEPDVELANWKAADLCEDGRLNVFDLCLMKQMLIEKS